MNDDDRAARYSDLFGQQHDHPPECSYCPICATISVVRNTRPEVLEHLGSAAREMIAALGLILEEAERFVSDMEGKTTSEKAQEPSKIRRIEVG